MDIHLHIERIVLHDVTLAAGEQERLHAAIREEIARLVQPRAGSGRPATGPTAELGRRIASAIHAAAPALPGPRSHP